jgi:hypothetical protein
MKCSQCKKEFTPRPHANNIKYCSVLCRNKVYYKKRGGAEAQREYLYKRAEGDKRPKIKCQICGKAYRQVGSHIAQVHGCTAREYREEYGFDVKKGQLPHDYRALKAGQAIECGGAKNLKLGKKYWFQKGDKKAGRYKRSDETMARLKRQIFIA